MSPELSATRARKQALALGLAAWLPGCLTLGLASPPAFPNSQLPILSSRPAPPH